MVLPSTPLSNAERQRRFRERNPGYYGRLHRQRKAEVEALMAARQAQAAALAAQAEPQALPAPAEITAFPQKPPLMLPAPVVDPMLEALNEMVASLKNKSAAREMLPIENKPATPGQDRAMAA